MTKTKTRLRDRLDRSRGESSTRLSPETRKSRRVATTMLIASLAMAGVVEVGPKMTEAVHSFAKTEQEAARQHERNKAREKAEEIQKKVESGEIRLVTERAEEGDGYYEILNRHRDGLDEAQRDDFVGYELELSDVIDNREDGRDIETGDYIVVGHTSAR